MIGNAEAMILRCIVEGYDYGSAIQRRIVTVFNVEMAFGQIYTSLDRMEIRGLLTSSESEPQAIRGGRAKRIYSITDAGSTSFHEFLNFCRSILKDYS